MSCDVAFLIFLPLLALWIVFIFLVETRGADLTRDLKRPVTLRDVVRIGTGKKPK